MKEKDKSIFFIQIICSLLIVNHHTSALDIPYLKTITKGGFILNTIFVFLSGYLLSISFTKQKNVNFFVFMKKRIQRIYPALYSVLFITLFYSLITSKEVIIINYVKWFSGFGFFFINNEIFSNNHLWFVSVILVCYLLFIPSYKLLEKKPFLVLIFISATIIIYNYLLTEEASSIYRNVNNYKVLRFLYHYLIFVFAIFWQQKNKSIKNYSFVKVISLIFCFIAYSYFTINTSYSIFALILALPISLLLIPIFYKLSAQLEKKLPIIFKLSSIPYELYLIHYLVIHFLSEYLHGNLFSYPLTFIISILLAFLINRMSSKAIKLFTSENIVHLKDNDIREGRINK